MAVDLTAWRALVDKELAGASFDKLVQKTPEGIALQPLYTDRVVDPPPPGIAPFVRGGTGADSSSGSASASATAAPFSICVRLEPGMDAASELDGGADALWSVTNPLDAVPSGQTEVIDVAMTRGCIVVNENDFSRLPSVEEIRTNDALTNASTAGLDELSREPAPGFAWWTSFDWVAPMVRGQFPIIDPTYWPLSALYRGDVSDPLVRNLCVSTRAFHDAGADTADELALGLSSLVATLRHLDDAGVPLAKLGHAMWAQVSIGRDTFGEICKLRALRVLWHQVLAASGVEHTALDAIHAVCSSRTLSTRDPWVNMLRGTTQVFAAALGGAQLITPLPFDAAFDTTSALGQRVARNTALVLREESQLGRVLDAAGGSYYIEARTDALAREAWSRFQAIEREGGIVRLLRTGALKSRLEAAWAQRASAIAKRKELVLGVSEFANLNETLPGTPRPPAGVHRDAEGFEALRARVEASALVDGAGVVSLFLLGPSAEHRARAGFAESFFAVAGLRTIAHADTMADAANAGRDAAQIVGVTADVTCICGSDERYATEAATTARALKTAGVKRVVLAGRPAEREAELRAAGVDAFIYVGCDVLATLEEVLA
jgi:methylmalonyl-CoA mutase